MAFALDLTGTILDRRYRITGLLGKGGMGYVYEAVHVALDQKVAVKVLHPRYANEERFRERFLQEARAVSRIRHPNVVEIKDFGDTPDGSVYFVMEYLCGHDVGVELRQHGTLPWPRTRRILLQAVGALHAAHGNRIIHRDIKPGNCFLIEDAAAGRIDVVKLLDFGIAKVGSDSHVDAQGKGLTGTGEVFGTASYMAPEQARGHALDARSDMYSLGIMAYEMLAGEVPFKGINALHVITRHLNDKPEPPRTHVPEIPAKVEALVLKMIAKEARDRYPSMEALEQALLEIPEDVGVRRTRLWSSPGDLRALVEEKKVASAGVLPPGGVGVGTDAERTAVVPGAVRRVGEHAAVGGVTKSSVGSSAPTLSRIVAPARGGAARVDRAAGDPAVRAPAVAPVQAAARAGAGARAPAMSPVQAGAVSRAPAVASSHAAPPAAAVRVADAPAARAHAATPFMASVAAVHGHGIAPAAQPHAAGPVAAAAHGAAATFVAPVGHAMASAPAAAPVNEAVGAQDGQRPVPAHGERAGASASWSQSTSSTGPLGRVGDTGETRPHTLEAMQVSGISGRLVFVVLVLVLLVGGASAVVTMVLLSSRGAEANEPARVVPRGAEEGSATPGSAVEGEAELHEEGAGLDVLKGPGVRGRVDPSETLDEHEQTPGLEVPRGAGELGAPSDAPEPVVEGEREVDRAAPSSDGRVSAREVEAATQPKVPEHETQKCVQARELASAALGRRGWGEVAEQTRNKRCWSPEEQSSRRRMRVMALLELGRFSDCAEAGAKATDTETVKMVAICRKQAGGVNG